MFRFSPERHRLFHLPERIDQHARREPAAVVVDEDAAERRHGFHEPVELGLLQRVVQAEDPEVHGEVQHHLAVLDEEEPVPSVAIHHARPVGRGGKDVDHRGISVVHSGHGVTSR